MCDKNKQDSTYHSLCYTSREALTVMRNSSMCPPRGIDQTIHCTHDQMLYHGHATDAGVNIN